MTERALLLSGIGGQGVQLAAQVVARAAVLEGREVSLFGSYGGMMRGGNTHATVVVGDGPIAAPPTVSVAWAAVVMHHDYWEFVRDRLRPGSLVLVNSTVFAADLDRSGITVLDVAATDLAFGLGHPMAASLVMVGALATVTGLVGVDAAAEAVVRSLPPYRTEHVTQSQAALRVGAAAVTPGTHPTWSGVPV